MFTTRSRQFPNWRRNSPSPPSVRWAVFFLRQHRRKCPRPDSERSGRRRRGGYV